MTISFGCMIFDSTQEHGAGWGCCANQPEATRRRGTSDLATDTVWLTNLDYDTTARAGLSNHVRFRRSDYMREPLSQLARRHSLQNPHEIASFGAKVFERVVQISMHCLRMEHIPRFALRNGIRSLIAGNDPCYPYEVYNAISEAISYNTNCERLWRPEEETIKYFKLPQRDHAMAILSTPLPAGEFTRWPGALPGTSDEVNEWMNEVAKPGLFKVTAKNFDETFNRLINYGDSPANERSQRRWVTNEELMLLSRFGEISVHDAFIASSICNLSALIDVLTKLPDAADMSLSAGLFAENLWAAAGTNLPNRTAETADTKSINAFTPYLRAMDRLICLQAARKIEEMGMEVVGYASGAIRVNCHDKSDHDMVVASIHAGCIPPACHLPLKDFPDGVDLQNPTPLQMMQIMYGCGLLPRILDTDGLITDRILNGA